jgi:hypothetical protein
MTPHLFKMQFEKILVRHLSYVRVYPSRRLPLPIPLLDRIKNQTHAFTSSRAQNLHELGPSRIFLYLSPTASTFALALVKPTFSCCFILPRLSYKVNSASARSISGSDSARKDGLGLPRFDFADFIDAVDSSRDKAAGDVKEGLLTPRVLWEPIRSSLDIEVDIDADMLRELRELERLRGRLALLALLRVRFDGEVARWAVTRFRAAVGSCEVVSCWAFYYTSIG